MNLGNLLNAVGWTLIHSLWVGALIGGVAFAMASSTRSSERRYLIFCTGMMALPLAMAALLVVQIETSSLPEIHAVALVAKGEIVRGGLGGVAAGRALPNEGMNWGKMIESLAWIWFVGVALMSLRAAGATLGVRRLRRSATRCDNSEWQNKLRVWSEKLGIKRAVSLCVTTLNEAPAVIGHFTPVILLPAAVITCLRSEQVEALILHELMHIRRSDFLVNALQLVCETLLFFHPVAWWLSRSLREEREHCCDDAVARFSGDRVEYARALLSLEEMRALSPELLTVGARGGSLKRRVQRLLAPPSSDGSGAGWAISIAITLLAAALLFWMLPQAHAQAAKPSLLELRMEAKDGEELPVEKPVQGMPATLHLSREAVVNASHVKKAEVTENAISKQKEISVTLNDEGRDRFAKVTKDAIGKRMAVVINGKIVQAPVIRSPITGGKFVISGNFSADEAAKLAKALSGEAKPEARVITVEIQSYFILMKDDPAKHFALGKTLKSDGGSSSTLSAVDARRIMVEAEQTKEMELLAAPAITTLNGRAAKIEMGDVPPANGATFSPNARGYVKTKDPKPDAEPALIGQSLEIMPEVRDDRLALRGNVMDTQKATRDGKDVVEKRFAGKIDSEISRGQALAMSLPSATEPKKHLLLLVIPVVTDW